MAQNLKRRQPGGPFYYRARINGRRVWRSTGFHDLERARVRAREMDGSIRAGDLGWGKPAPTVREWWATYQSAYTPKKRAAHRDAQLIAGFLYAYGAARLNTIKRSDCEKWVNTSRVSARTKRPLAPGTIRREAGFLKAFFQRAIEDGLIKTNPWKGVRAPADVARERVLSYTEEAKLRPVLRADYDRLLTVLLGTGLRNRELRSLTPKNVGPESLWVIGKGGKFRKIPLRDDVAEALAAQQQGTGPYWTQHQSVLTRILKRACKRAGVTPYVTLHDLRRTFASRCAASGMRPKTLQELMGHASIEVTMKHYVQVDDATKAAELRAVGKVAVWAAQRAAGEKT